MSGVSNSGPGVVTVNFTMDGESIEKDYPPSPMPDPNFVWYSNDLLPAGDHALLLEITRSDGAAFTLDYVLFNPSFGSLAEKPSITSSSSVPQNTRSKTTPAGAIAGGLIGGAVILFVVLGFLYRRKRSKRGTRSIDLLRVGSIEAFPPPSYPETTISTDLDSDVRRKPLIVTQISDTTESSNHQLEAGARSVSLSTMLIPHRKPPLPRNGLNQIPQSMQGGVEVESSRVQELVVELQRELAGTSEQGRSQALRVLLPLEARRSQSQWSLAPSTVPPPYEGEYGWNGVMR
ncbi:hypothetical protein H0H87_007826 [Tephrocybe sp. NHM501043]|nr:hypothetical protein H0H87_007826 [Tephrocybe sp. NHM501043]